MSYFLKRYKIDNNKILIIRKGINMIDKNNSNKIQTSSHVISKFFCIMIVTLTMVPIVTAKQADAFEQNKKLGRGVNIIGYDRIWRSKEWGRFKEKHFKIIKEGGFDTVRINLHPFRHMSKSEPYQLSNSWFEVLDWAVENALKNKLMVILDMHEFGAMGNDPKGNKERILSFWRQVASHLKDASEDVLFEILNEPSRKLTGKLWDEYYREALAIIRQTNPIRTVVIGPPFWNSVNHLNEFKLPDDDRNIIVTVHYYHPMDFTHQGASWAGRRDKVGVEWGTVEEKQAKGSVHRPPGSVVAHAALFELVPGQKTTGGNGFIAGEAQSPLAPEPSGQFRGKYEGGIGIVNPIPDRREKLHGGELHITEAHQVMSFFSRPSSFRHLGLVLTRISSLTL